MQQVQSFLKLWNDGSSISTLTAFIDEEDKALVLNKDNKNYNLYLTMREKYLSTTDEKRTDFREKSKDNPHYETVCLLDKLIELRRVGEVMKMNGFTCGKRILTASFKEKEQNEQEERQVLSMKPINTYKKCLCCGSKHQATAERKKCLCGGHLYLIGTVYQPKIMRGGK